MRQPEVAQADRRLPREAELYIDDWLFVKPVSLKRGEACAQHAHLHDHATFVAVGTLRGWCDGQDIGEVSAPGHFKINALAEHRFIAVTDALFYCIHNLRGEGYPAIAEEA